GPSIIRISRQQLLQRLLAGGRVAALPGRSRRVELCVVPALVEIVSDLRFARLSLGTDVFDLIASDVFAKEIPARAARQSGTRHQSSDAKSEAGSAKRGPFEIAMHGAIHQASLGRRRQYGAGAGG